jgi:hypothetical protein
MGAGIVARDHSGSFLAAWSQISEDVLIPELAEALAVRRALSCALEEGFSRIIIASDCLLVIQRANSSVTDRSLCGAVIEDIKTCSNLFSSCAFLHVFRVHNVVSPESSVTDTVALPQNRLKWRGSGQILRIPR